MDWGWDNARAFAGMAVIFAIAWGLSENRRAFPWRIVLGAVSLQFTFALALFGVPIVRKVFFKANLLVDRLIDATAYGTSFVFGPVFGSQVGWEGLTGQPGPIFAVHLLPLIIVIAALSAILWHWHILRWITQGFALLFRRFMGIGGATSLAVAANVFMGMTEAPVLVKPYLKSMSRSQLFILMTTGFATVAGSVLVLYSVFLEPVMTNPLAQLLTASIMAAPAAVALALIIIPEVGIQPTVREEPDFEYESTMDAFATGATDGLKIVANIITMLIAALALLFLLNAFLAWAGAAAGFSPWNLAKSIDINNVPERLRLMGLFEVSIPHWLAAILDFFGKALEWFIEVVVFLILGIIKVLLMPFGILQSYTGGVNLSIEVVLGWVFAPLMYLIGVPWEEAARSGALLGVKTVLTEFVAFLQLAEIPPEAMAPRTRIITAHAINGFANFGSIGILIGGLSIIAPERRDTFLALAGKTLIAGTLATCLSGAVVGALPVQLFTSG